MRRNALPSGSRRSDRLEDDVGRGLAEAEEPLLVLVRDADLDLVVEADLAVAERLAQVGDRALGDVARREEPRRAAGGEVERVERGLQRPRAVVEEDLLVPGDELGAGVGLQVPGDDLGALLDLHLDLRHRDVAVHNGGVPVGPLA